GQHATSPQTRGGPRRMLQCSGSAIQGSSTQNLRRNLQTRSEGRPHTTLGNLTAKYAETGNFGPRVWIRVHLALSPRAVPVNFRFADEQQSEQSGCRAKRRRAVVRFVPPSIVRVPPSRIARARWGL